MIKPTRLKPMPIRVTPQQHAALNQLRAEDGASAQEHVRRAIDLYLAKKKRERGGAGEASQMPVERQPTGVQPEAAQQELVTAEADGRTAQKRYGYR